MNERDGHAELSNRFLDPGQAFEALQPSCLAKGPRPRILLWGDSHAAHLSHGLTRALPQGLLLRATMAQCVPHVEAGQSPACTDFNRRLPGLVRAHARRCRALGQLDAHRDDAGRAGEPAHHDQGDRGYRQQGGGDRASPQFDRPLPHLLVAAKRFGVATDGHMLDLLGDVDGFMHALLKDVAQTDYVSLLGLLCPAGACVLRTSDGAPLAWDDGHFTAQGSELAATRIVATSPALAAAADAAGNRE